MRIRPLAVAALLSSCIAASGGPAGAGLSPADSARHALNRLAYGPRPGQVESISQSGVLRWIDEQLSASPAPDARLMELEQTFPVLGMTQAGLAWCELPLRGPRPVALQAAWEPGRLSGAPGQWHPSPPDRVSLQYQELAVARAVEAQGQLRETLTDFWLNYFNVPAVTPVQRVLFPGYLESVIRAHALGRFEELLVATSRNPAMLVYLGNTANVSPGAIRPAVVSAASSRQRLMLLGGLEDDSARLAHLVRRSRGLSEAYARQLLTAQTLGPDCGLTHGDITEAARILSGWSADATPDGWVFSFHDWAHDVGEKTVHGMPFPSDQEEGEGFWLLHALAGHPATIQHVCGRLCARFVGPNPPPACVEAAEGAWRQSDGDIREVLLAIFHSPEFWSDEARAHRTKPPLEFVASALRAVGAVMDTLTGPAGAVAALGEPLFMRNSPSGYPDSDPRWTRASHLAARRKFAMALARNRVPGATVRLAAVLPASANPDTLVAAANLNLLGGRMSEGTRREMLRAIGTARDPGRARATTVGMALGSPEFQTE